MINKELKKVIDKMISGCTSLSVTHVLKFSLSKAGISYTK